MFILIVRMSCIPMLTFGSRNVVNGICSSLDRNKKKQTIVLWGSPWRTILMTHYLGYEVGCG